MSFLSDIFGKKPKVPEFQRTSLPEQQGKAINANLAALPGAEDLVGKANVFTRQQIQDMLRATIPNYDAITKTATGNIQSMLKGELPQDVQGQISRNAAAKALGGGYAGSGSHGNLVARDLGLTSLDLTQQGLSSAESWFKMSDQMFSPGMLNVSSMFITPQQQFESEFQQNTLQFQRDWMSNQIKAMPDPVLSGINDQVYGLLQSVAGSFGGMGGVGGGGGGASSASSGSSWKFIEQYLNS